MLQFAVYDDNGPAEDWPIINAHLVTRDDLPTPGAVSFERGYVTCQKRGSRAVGLSLLYDVGTMGRLMLQTSLLPERDEPYVLSVELARHRIKMFIVKSEEWQMFDLSDGHPAMKMWEQARQLFSKAVVCDDPREADRLARQSLEHGIEATERLALAHAQILLYRRFATRRAASSTLGIRIAPSLGGTQVRELIEREFDVVVVPLFWRDLEVQEGQYQWDAIDRWMQWAKQTGKPVVAGPLLDFSKNALPEWMYVWQHDYDTCRDLAYDHIERVVQRYGSFVSIWNLASGLNVNSNFQFTNDQMVDLVRMARLLVQQANKGARTMIELTEPFGEYGASQRDSLQPLAFVDRLVQEGIRLDAIGVQILFGQQHSGRAARDLMQISHMLDQFFLVEIPLFVSALGVPSEMSDPDGGWWHEKWSDEQQSEWIAKFFAMAMSKPYVESLFWSDLFDHAKASVPNGGLVNEQGRGKPALQRLIGMRKRLRKPLGPLKLPNRPE